MPEPKIITPHLARVPEPPQASGAPALLTTYGGTCMKLNMHTLVAQNTQEVRDAPADGGMA